MSNFKRISTKSFGPQAGELPSVDETYWKELGFPVTTKELGPITHIDFAPASERLFAATASAKVQLYSTVTKEVQVSLSRFHDTAYGGSFRSDGKLLVAGSEGGRIRLFDVDRKSQLRIFNGHKAATHLCKFLSNNTQAVSFSDDKSVIVWDITNEDVVMRFNEHEDYVRTGAVNAACNNTFISGSYDHKVKMFDMRTAKSTMQVDHGAPVESVLFFPNGGVFISAGGTEIKVWDVLAGGKLIANLSQHHKTVTCLSLASNNGRLLSGSLDKNVKIYSVETYQVVHTLNFPSSILSLGISSSDETLAVGMVDGLLSIQTRIPSVNKKLQLRRPLSDASSSFQWPQCQFVGSRDWNKLRKFEVLLKKFELAESLDAAIKQHGKLEPEVVMAVIQELTRHGSIKAAVAGRTEESIHMLLTFICLNLGNQSFGYLLLDFAVLVLDIYGDTIKESTLLCNRFKKLASLVTMELDSMQQMMAINGAMDLLMFASAPNFSDTMNYNCGNEITVRSGAKMHNMNSMDADET